ncbi:MAG: XRE family transcriptional regulator [Candidatus Contendobacter sp.]|nr:XRE family transcriptional regulator [Candidatus Contendobacter sp.]
MRDESPRVLAGRTDRLPPSSPRAEVIPLPAEPGPGACAGSLAAVIGGHVRKLRKRRGLSLEALAGRSGVSRAMLSQIELGRSTPTVAVLCKIAHALEAPLSTFLGEERAESVWPLPAAGAKRLLSGDGRVCLRALFSPDPPRWVEFYELRLKGRGEEAFGPQPPGTIKNLVVSQGEIEIVIAENRYALAAGDAIQFVADVAHVYRNLGQAKAVMYVVTSHARIAS